MIIITRYILKKCLSNTLLILLALISVFSIAKVLGQIGDVGRGDFNIFTVLVYIALLIPSYLYLLMPLAVLIGVMLAMIGMVNYSEYAIIRTSGVSLRRISLVLLGYGFIFALITFVLGEFISPVANNYAQIYKKTKTHEMVSTKLQSGIWSKDGGDSFVNIKQILPGSNTILGVKIFKYDSMFNLQQYITAKSGYYDSNKNVWILPTFIQYSYTSEDILRIESNNYQWKSTINPKYFRVLVVAPEDMSVFLLFKYITHLSANHEATARYAVVFWSKLVYPIACISMALIALAFIPNNFRNINLGSRLFAGLLIGISFFFIMRLIGYLTSVFHWNPIVSSSLPTIILFAGGWWFVLRKN